MHCSHCGVCCEETEMELSCADIERLERTGYRRKDFTVIDESGMLRLRNVGGRCFFYDVAKNRCREYSNRPLGCYIYPVVFSVSEGVIVHDLCPMGETISDQELKAKGRVLLETLKVMDEEYNR
jgi:Fe-S-cluster containining protein